MSYYYHKLLKHVYFEGYANSYEEAEYFLEQLSDEDLDLIIQEGKKKDERQRRLDILRRAYLQGSQSASPRIIDYGGGEPNSPERDDAIKRMIQNSGGSAVKKEIKHRNRQATKVAKKIIKNDP